MRAAFSKFSKLPTNFGNYINISESINPVAHHLRRLQPPLNFQVLGLQQHFHQQKPNTKKGEKAQELFNIHALLLLICCFCFLITPLVLRWNNSYLSIQLWGMRVINLSIKFSAFKFRQSDVENWKACYSLLPILRCQLRQPRASCLSSYGCISLLYYPN